MAEIKCKTCGDSGDVHTIDGQWRGECKACDAAEILRMRGTIKRQAAEIELLRYALAKARDGLSCGLWDYGPGQSEHDQCDALIGEIDDILGDRE